jgi:flagellar biosynthesis/type III secretory pathway protein FliH
LREALERAFGVASAARVDRSRLVAGAEGAVIRLALDIARAVIAKEVVSTPDVMQGLLTRAMLKAAGDDRLRLRLHPGTIALLGDALTEVADRFAHRGVDVVADAGIAETGVVVDTRTGRVDAGVETQLARIEGALLDLAGDG